MVSFKQVSPCHNLFALTSALVGGDQENGSSY